MADDIDEIQEQQTQEGTSQQQGIQFEDILPYGAEGGDTGLSSRLKLKRNFEKIKMWIDSHGILNIDFLGDIFLSKVGDDEANGLIGFLKGAWFGTKEWMIDALGNANLRNMTVNGILRALNAYINKVQSTNYTGDSMTDTGWRITNEYEGGNSKATFDYLYIRKKAIFEELELRKLSHIGGNFCLSPASGKAWQVDAYDAEGNLLGYDTYTIPYLLGGRILALFSKSAANRFLARKKRLARKLTDEELSRMRRVRVYLFSDDGTTKTMSNWTVGAQARSQTFNITAQMDYHGSGEDSDNPDVEFWTGKKVQNTYWWRLVSAVGRGLAADGKMHDYVEFLVNTGSRTQEDAGSDIPAVGDEFGQFGHRTNPNQQHVIMIETANDDSPAIKFYSGINSWNLNGKRPIIISPKQFEVKASMFRWITEYGDEQAQLINRGLWVELPVDAEDKRRCYYNDLVSHNGAVWRCIVATGTHKEDVNGHWYTQDELDHMTLEQIMELTDVANYTTDEPGENSTDWQKYVYAAVAPYVKLSEALVAIPCEKDGKATAAVSKKITVKLMVTNIEATISGVTIDGADSVVSKDPNSNNIIISINKDAIVTNKDYAITVEGDATMPGQTGGQHYVATTSLSVYGVSKGNDAYDVALSPAVWIFSQATIEPYELNIDKNRTGNSSTGVTVTVDGKKQPFLITGVVASVNTIGLEYDRNTGTDNRVWVTSMPNDIETAYADITIKYANGAVATKRIQIYCNLLGTWKETVIGDTKTEIAERTNFDVCDETGRVIGTKTLGEYIKSSSQDSATLNKDTYTIDTQGNKVTQVSQTNKRVSTAEGNITNIRKDLYGEGGATTKFYSKSETAEYVRQQLFSGSGTSTPIYSTVSATATQIGNMVTQMNGQSLIDVAMSSSGAWEQGGILNNPGRSYASNKQIPAGSDYIRTKNLIPVGSSLTMSIGTGYAIVVYQFDVNSLFLRKTAYQTNLATVNFQSDVRYVALEMFTNTNPREAISPSVIDEALTIGNLQAVGIDIDNTNKKVTLIADKVDFKRSNGEAANIHFVTESGYEAYTIGGFYITNGKMRDTASENQQGSKVLLYSDGRLYLNSNGNSGAAALTVNGGTTIGGGNNEVSIGSVYQTRFTGYVVMNDNSGYFKDSVCFRSNKYSENTKYNRLKIGYIEKGLGHKVVIDAPTDDWPRSGDVGSGEVYVAAGGVLKVKGLENLT